MEAFKYHELQTTSLHGKCGMVPDLDEIHNHFQETTFLLEAESKYSKFLSTPEKKIFGCSANQFFTAVLTSSLL